MSGLDTDLKRDQPPFSIEKVFNTLLLGLVKMGSCSSLLVHQGECFTLYFWQYRWQTQFETIHNDTYNSLNIGTVENTLGF